MTKSKSEQNKAGPSAAPADPMALYFTRDRANIAQRIYLYDPATREATKDYIDVLSSLSDEFRETRDEVMQAAATVAQEPDEKKRRELIQNEQRRMFSSLIAGWSFDKECTTENKMEFLKNAPQILNMVMSVADDSERFFGNASAG